jgi:excisionase family DNA binding protein
MAPKSLPEELESKPGLLNVKDLAEILGLHPETVRDWAREGRLPHVRIGYAIKFDRHRIADWIRARESAVPVQRSGVQKVTVPPAHSRLS